MMKITETTTEFRKVESLVSHKRFSDCQEPTARTANKAIKNQLWLNHLLSSAVKGEEFTSSDPAGVRVDPG
jgi:hypothetical protein